MKEADQSNHLIGLEEIRALYDESPTRLIYGLFTRIENLETRIKDLLRLQSGEAGFLEVCRIKTRLGLHETKCNNDDIHIYSGFENV